MKTEQSVTVWSTDFRVLYQGSEYAAHTALGAGEYLAYNAKGQAVHLNVFDGRSLVKEPLETVLFSGKI